MDLRQLRYLVATSDEGGVRAAARRLHTTQPQMSRALRDLERELGVELLHRRRGGVELTPAGTELVAQGREILERVATAGATMRRLGEERSATLRVGLHSGTVSAAELLGPILRAYRSARPDINVTVHDLGICDQVTPLLRGEVDVAVVRPPAEHDDLVVTPIAEEPRLIMTGWSHELAREDAVSVDDILGFPTLPLGCRPDWCEFWQLNPERGVANAASHVAPARTVADAQFAVANDSVIVTVAATIGRLTPNPVSRTIPLRDVSPSLISVAYKRRDVSRAVLDFVTSAQATAERYIHLLPGGTLPA